MYLNFDVVLKLAVESQQLVYCKSLVKGYKCVSIPRIRECADVEVETAFEFFDAYNNVCVAMYYSKVKRIFSFVTYCFSHSGWYTEANSNILMTKLREQITGETEFVFTA